MYLRNGNFEALADGLEHLLVIVTADKGDGKTLGTETPRTTEQEENENSYQRRNTFNIPDSVKIAVGVWRTVVIDDNIDSFNVNTTAENIGGN